MGWDSRRRDEIGSKGSRAEKGKDLSLHLGRCLPSSKSYTGRGEDLVRMRGPVRTGGIRGPKASTGDWNILGMEMPGQTVGRESS